MKYIKLYNEKFDIINNNLKHEIKEYLLTKYPSEWWNKSNDKDIVINDIKQKFLLSELDYENNNIEQIIIDYEKLIK